MQGTAPAQPPDYAREVLARLTEAFGGRIRALPSVDWPTARVARGAIAEVCLFLRDGDGLGFSFLTDITGVDWLGSPRAAESGARFEVVYHLFSLSRNHRIRLKSPVPEDDPHIASVAAIWPAANWHEREVFDMYGVVFDGHPGLSKILTPDFLDGHPLRKDFPLGDEDVWSAEGGSIVQPPGDYRPTDPRGVKRFR